MLVKHTPPLSMAALISGVENLTLKVQDFIN